MNNEKQEYLERLKKYHESRRNGGTEWNYGTGRNYEGFGESHHLREWARRLGVPHGSLRRYLLKGLTIEEISDVRGIKYTGTK